MDRILKKIFIWDRKQALDTILQIYHQQHFCIVDYIYFANVYGKKLFTDHKTDGDIGLFQHALLQDYKDTQLSLIHKLYQDALMDADLVLMDGIALQIFYLLANRRWLPNLNGTDFAPYVLSSLAQKVGYGKLRLVLYGTYPHLLEKTKVFLQDQWYQVVYAQDGYTNLDRDQVKNSLPSEHSGINVLLVARTTPQYPIQEIRSYANKEKIKAHRFLVLDQWWTFDFWVGEQKRWPKLFQYLRLERLYRLISRPKRNYKKVLDSLGILHYIFSYLLLKKRTR